MRMHYTKAMLSLEFSRLTDFDRVTCGAGDRGSQGDGAVTLSLLCRKQLGYLASHCLVLADVLLDLMSFSLPSLFYLS